MTHKQTQPDNHASNAGSPFAKEWSSLSLLRLSSRWQSLWAMLVVAVIFALALPLANLFFVYPAFTDVLITSIEEDAKKLGNYLVPPELKHSEIRKERLSQRLYGDIYKLEHDFGIAKLRIFSPQGEVLYSTNSAEIGTHNTNAYFTETVSKGIVYTKMAEKGGLDMEGEPARLDVIETFLPLMNGDRFLGAFELLYDITERKGQLDRLILFSTILMTLMAACLVVAIAFLLKKEASHQLAQQRAEALKGDIERITQHDLKAPIIGILSGIQYLEKFTDVDSEQKNMLRQMHDAADRSVSMINGSLGLYKMEMGTYQYAPADMDILDVLRRAVWNLSEMTALNGVEVAITRGSNPVGDEDTFPFCAEEPLFYSLVTNLLKNAVEASTRGDRVLINLGEDGGVKLSIHNPAPVPKDIRQTFFDKYATSGKSSGTGLGTYSARLMALAMGGTIEMSTATASGTLITVRLPHPPKPAQPGDTTCPS